jgi:Gamma-glutamyl cyclotransferase, AIG2-like
MSESTLRRIDVFFYGLFMDEDVLRAKNVCPTNPRQASIDNFTLVIGQRATLVPTVGETVHGFVFALTHDEVDTLYGEQSVKVYRPEPVLAHLNDGGAIPVLCFSLPNQNSSNERNLEYAAKLRELATRLNLPADYVQKI